MNTVEVEAYQPMYISEYQLYASSIAGEHNLVKAMVIALKAFTLRVREEINQ